MGREFGKEEDNYIVREALRDFLYRWREVFTNGHIVLENNDVALSEWEIRESLSVAVPRIRWDGLMS